VTVFQADWLCARRTDELLPGGNRWRMLDILQRRRDPRRNAHDVDFAASLFLHGSKKLSTEPRLSGLPSMLPEYAIGEDPGTIDGNGPSFVFGHYTISSTISREYTRGRDMALENPPLGLDSKKNHR